VSAKWTCMVQFLTANLVHIITYKHALDFQESSTRYQLGSLPLSSEAAFWAGPSTLLHFKTGNLAWLMLLGMWTLIKATLILLTQNSSSYYVNKSNRLYDLVVLDDIMAQTVGNMGIETIHCTLSNLAHVNAAELWQVPSNLFITWWALHGRQPFGQWRLGAVA